VVFGPWGQGAILTVDIFQIQQVFPTIGSSKQILARKKKVAFRRFNWHNKRALHAANSAKTNSRSQIKLS